MGEGRAIGRAERNMDRGRDMDRERIGKGGERDRERGLRIGMEGR